MADDVHTVRQTHVYLTGFGPFASIKLNPSVPVGKTVAAALRERQVAPVVEFVELETSVDGVGRFFAELERQLQAELAEDPARRFLLVHLGVHSAERNGLLRVELRGYNELFARVPDARGVVLNHELIFPNDGGLEVYRESWFGREGTPQQTALTRVVERRNARIHAGQKQDPLEPSVQPPRWVISHDAGRYICNLCLYQSLKLQEKYSDKVVSIFLHICDDKQGQTRDEPISPSYPEDVQVTSELDNSPVVRYNPSLAEQSKEVGLLVLDLLDIIAKAP